MIAVDTNILVHAHRPASPHHSAARDALADLGRRDLPWAVPWPCVHEFLSVVTGPRMPDPTPPDEALAAIAALVTLPTVQLLGEARRHLDLLAELVGPNGPRGARVHDAKVAAICLGHGVDELWTADRDYSYFPRLRTRNPLVG
jgi:toxin-antitoxin system PIN domain toxin